MESLLQDVRYGVRTLVKNPGFAAVAVLTLAIGIGANTAMFSAINATILRPLPVEEPGRLVRVYTSERGGGSPRGLSYPDYLDIRDRSDVLSGVLGYKLTHVALNEGGENDLVWGE